MCRLLGGRGNRFFLSPFWDVPPKCGVARCYAWSTSLAIMASIQNARVPTYNSDENYFGLDGWMDVWAGGDGLK